MVTLTPSSDVGRLLPLKSESFQLRVVLARLLPCIVTQEPDSMAGRKLAPSTTAEMVGGPVGTFTTNP